MQDFGGKIFDEIEVLVKSGELSTYKHSFNGVKAIMCETTLIIVEIQENVDTYRIFNYSEIKAFNMKHNKTT